MSGFNASFSGIGEMLNADFILADMVARAEKVKAEAEATAPYDASHTGTHYKDAFTVTAKTRGGRHNDRAVAYVTNDDDAAPFVEFGATHTPKYRTLGRALDAARD